MPTAHDRFLDFLRSDKHLRLSSTPIPHKYADPVERGTSGSEGVYPLRGERTWGLAPSVRAREGSFRPELAREPVQSWPPPPINPAPYHSAAHRPSPSSTVPITVGTETDGSGKVSQLSSADSPSPVCHGLRLFFY